ncbi:polymeric immunoglobulin receptor-like [Pelmatolapia mariae]|uniref:polymeric immunoglobulin receptor-like n=1 Tax=Pelmatolapia mariae TaxID=158779 RepID=UPI002FE5E9DC
MVKVSCSYDEGYESYEKYLCKNNCGSNDDVLITTSESRKNKYVIHDDKTARIFTTTISDLHSADAGIYWCGVTRTGKDIYTEVKLKLVQDRCCDTVTKVQSYEGYSESVSCTYESQYQNNLKYICRGNQPSTCLQQALITSDKEQNGRFRLDDDKVLGTFTVTINSLVKSDSGSYLCGVQRNSDLDVFSAVELKVKVFQQHTGNGASTVETPAQISDAGQYVVYAVPPVLLVLICVLVLIVYKCKRQKIKGNEAVMNRNTSKTGGLEEVMGAAENSIYGNDEVVRYSEKQTSKIACNDYHDAGEDEPDYENCTQSEEIYCNEDFHKANRR